MKETQFLEREVSETKTEVSKCRNIIANLSRVVDELMNSQNEINAKVDEIVTFIQNEKMQNIVVGIVCRIIGFAVPKYFIGDICEIVTLKWFL